MLSAAQARALFDKATSCLATIEAKAGADPAAKIANARELDTILDQLDKGLASPHSTWQTLLKQQVPSTVLAACCTLIATQQDKPWGVATYAAAATAERLLMAAQDSPTGCASSSKSNKLSVMFTAQLEQSGFPQLLPRLFSRFTAAVQADIATGDFSAGPYLAQQAVTCLQIQQRLSTLFGTSFPRTHAAGPAVLESALRLAHVSMQYISKVLQQVGWQDWMVVWLRLGCNSATAAAGGACHREANSQPSSDSGADRVSSSTASSSDASSSEISTGDTAVYCAEAAVQWLCLMVLLQTLAPWLAKRTRHAPDSSSAQHWAAVAALAASMPPAYSDMADQLGCSRELVLLMAGALSRLKGLRFGADFCLQLAFQQHAPTGLVMALPAVVLQWLSDMSPRQLISRAELCAKACARAFQAFEDARTLATQHSRHEVTGLVNTVSAAAHDLCVSALQKLLGAWRSLSDKDTIEQSASVPASSTSGSQSPAGAQASNSRSKQLMYVQAACHTVVIMLCRTVEAQSMPSSAAADDAAGCSESAGAASSSLPAGHAAAAPPADSPQPATAAACSVLQQYVRQAAATAQDNTQVDAVMMTAFQGVTLSMCSLLATPEMMGSTHMGALVKPVVIASQLDSPDALQLLDLPYSLLKAINSMPIRSTPQLGTAVAGLICAAAVTGAVAEVLGTALRQALPGSSAAAPNISSNAAVMLPWLVLLGRCAAAVATQAGAAPAPSLESLNCTALSLLLARVAEGWLQAGPITAELSAMGYEPETLLDHLRGASARNDTELLAPAQGCCEEPNVESEARADALLSASWLQAVGCTLTSFAVPTCCNNPACLNTAGPSEAQLVNGRGNLCGGCRVARYCSRPCLRQHWGQHKPVCKALAAAAAAAQAGCAANSAAQVLSG